MAPSASAPQDHATDRADSPPAAGRAFWRTAWQPLAVVVVVHLAIVVGYSAFYHFNLSCFLNVGHGHVAIEAYFSIYRSRLSQLFVRVKHPVLFFFMALKAKKCSAK